MSAPPGAVAGVHDTTAVGVEHTAEQHMEWMVAETLDGGDGGCTDGVTHALCDTRSNRRRNIAYTTSLALLNSHVAIPKIPTPFTGRKAVGATVLGPGSHAVRVWAPSIHT